MVDPFPSEVAIPTGSSSFHIAKITIARCQGTNLRLLAHISERTPEWSSLCFLALILKGECALLRV